MHTCCDRNRTSWMQRAVADGRIMLEKFPGMSSAADVGTQVPGDTVLADTNEVDSHSHV